MNKDKLEFQFQLLLISRGKEEQFQFSIEEIKVGNLMKDNKFKITFDSIALLIVMVREKQLHSEITVSFGTFIPDEKGNNNQNIPGCEGNKIITENGIEGLLEVIARKKM